ncbi:MAG: oxygenase MpaB family protein [Chitinophagales bacterium]
MTTRFVYRERVKNSIWPTAFKLLGRTIFDAPNVMPSERRVAQFEKYLLESDEMADAAAKDLFMSGRNHKASFRLMNQVLENGSTALEEIPESFKNLVDVSYQDPKWLDREKLERGSAVCRRLGGWAMTVLGDMALLGGYANSEITKPLVFTGALKGDSTFDRVSETSQFWFDVTRANGLDIGAKGFKSALKVRMMHAIIRQRLTNHPKWDSQAWGLPINKADAVATNVGFSMVMLYGAKMLGFHLPNKDIEAVLHLWKYIGYLMGDEVGWLPNTAEEGLQSLLLIMLSNQNDPDEESKILAYDYLNNYKPRASITEFDKYSFELFNFIKHRAYARYLIPFDIYKKLELPSSYMTWLVIPLIQTPTIFTLDRLRLVIPGMTKRMEEFGAKEQEKIIFDRMGERQATYVPK